VSGAEVLGAHTVRAIEDAAAAWLAGRRFSGPAVICPDAVYAVAQAAGVLALYGSPDAWHRAAWFRCERALRDATAER